MNKKSKNRALLLSALIGVLIGSNTSYANNTAIIQNESPVLINEADMATRENRVMANTTIQGDGSLKKAEEYVERKLFDVVGFFQSFIKPLTYVTFIISAMTILFGVITNSKKGLTLGILGMAVSIIIYVAVIFAPQIVEYLGAWLSV